MGSYFFQYFSVAELVKMRLETTGTFLRRCFMNLKGPIQKNLKDNGSGFRCILIARPIAINSKSAGAEELR